MSIVAVPDEKKYTLTDHLMELRRRLYYISVCLAITVSASFIWLADYVMRYFKSRAPGVDLVFLKPTELMGTYMKVSLYLGIAIGIPFIVYQIVAFVAPALTPKEKKYVYTLIPGVFVCFIGGVVFAYYLMIPPALNILLNFKAEYARPTISIESYVSLVVTILFWAGAVFELPWLMAFLSRLGLITPKWIAKYRKYAFVGAFVLGAIITPTMDPVNQSIVAGTLMGLWEISYWLSRITQKRKPKAQPA